jgi:uncharacterized protein YqfA (UPF0365 family)
MDQMLLSIHLVPLILLLAVVLPAGLLVVALEVVPILGLYLQTMIAGAPVSLITMLDMSFRKTLRPALIAHIRLTKATINVPVQTIEKHILAGGNAVNVVSALIIAKGARETLAWETAAALDLHGDVVAEVTTMLRKAGKICPEGQQPAI